MKYSYWIVLLFLLQSCSSNKYQTNNDIKCYGEYVTEYVNPINSKYEYAKGSELEGHTVVVLRGFSPSISLWINDEEYRYSDNKEKRYGEYEAVQIEHTDTDMVIKIVDRITKTCVEFVLEKRYAWLFAYGNQGGGYDFHLQYHPYYFVGVN
jgi:hypothetical protein